MVSGTFVHDVKADGSLSQGGMYLITKDEDYWNSLAEETRTFTWGRWRKEAEQLGANRVVLKLVPDPIFPTGDNELPYLAQQERIGQEEEKPVEVCPCCKRPL